jgi:hypothetical protein
MNKIEIDTILDPQQTEELWWLLENFALMFLHGIKVKWLLHNRGTFHCTQGFPPCRTTPNRLSHWEGFEMNKQI